MPRDLPGADLAASPAESERPERERAPRDLPGADLAASPAESERPEPERVLRDLPGADLIASGVEALRRGELTVEALLVAVGARRLRDAGLEIPAPPDLPDSPELLLYAAVGAAHPRDAHSRYNGLIRRLVSFERALEGVGTHARAPGSSPPRKFAGSTDAASGDRNEARSPRAPAARSGARAGGSGASESDQSPASNDASSASQASYSSSVWTVTKPRIR